jgi:hypothetical protein
MNRASGRDLHQFLVLFCAQGSSQFYFNIDSIDHAFFGFALLAVPGMNAGVPERNQDFFQRKMISPRVKADCHRGANAKTREQVIVRIRPDITATDVHRFVCDKLMSASCDFLLKILGAAAHDNMRCLFVALCSHKRNQGRRIPAKRSRYDQTRNSSSTATKIAIGRPSGFIKM